MTPPPSAQAAGQHGPGEWVLLSYRLPREPSTPRISVWRKLKRLGVAQISDGLVALPADARTREHLEWIADEVTDAGGNATIWFARPATLAQERELAAQMAAARAAEYAAVAARAGQAAEATEPGSAAALAALRRLRAELRRIARRDYFPPAERQHARAAVEALTTGTPAGDAAAEPSPPVPTSQETPQP
ncbi:Chromate resistance protein ChrB [Actinomadura rudentiformis]|uniref:Chromate resistance protein ChrB n=1 Tax=Actinomadura rudentiformis TaxID=359158 RepID=UPI001CEF8E77|nr:Chromate resistance protein ChrB [Actinomadura rudentiformis]